MVLLSVFLLHLKKKCSASSAHLLRMIDDSYYDRIHSSLTTVHCFNNRYVGKQPVAWKEYCAEYWLKDLQESMDRCTGHRYITEILFKTALKSYNHTIIQSINIYPSLNVRHHGLTLYLTCQFWALPVQQQIKIRCQKY